MPSFPHGSPVPDSTAQQHFGLVVAYIVPGFVALAGIIPLAPAVASWLTTVAEALKFVRMHLQFSLLTHAEIPAPEDCVAVAALG